MRDGPHNRQRSVELVRVCLGPAEMACEKGMKKESLLANILQGHISL